MRNKLVLAAAALGLIAAACGGGSDATTTTTASPAAAPSDDGSAAPSTTTAPEAKETTTTGAPTVSASSNEYCLQADDSDPFDSIDLLGGNLEEQVNTWLALLDEVEANAPAEIADDIAVLTAAARSMAAVLAENDYDLFSIPPDDPRFLAFDAPEIEQASRNIALFCGIDPDEFDSAAGGVTDDGGIVGGIGTADLPADFPQALLPPDLEGVDNNGAGGLFLSSSATFDDTYAYYQDLFGSPADEFEGSATFSGMIDGRQRIVNINANPGGLTLITIISL